MDLNITSAANPRVKEVARIRKTGDEDRFLIDGVREIGLALKAGYEIDAAFHTAEFAPEANAVLASLRAAGCETFSTAQDAFAKLAYGDRRSGLVAVAKKRRLALHDWKPSENPLIVVLVGLEKPGNLGAIVRTADAAGATGVIVADAVTDIHNANVVRASRGALFTVSVALATSTETKVWLAKNAIKVVTARCDGVRDYTQCDFVGPIAMVLGSEDQGLGSEWNDEAFESVRIPMHGAGDSLNVSVTAAVLLYEAIRQRAK